MKLILVTGLPGAGKTEFAEVARSLGLPVVSMGDAVRAEAQRRGLPVSRETLSELAHQLRKDRGPGVVAELCLTQLRSLGSSTAVIDGVRSPAEVAVFRHAANKVVVVGIHAAPRVRFERLRSRGRADDPRSWEVFQNRDREELGFGIGAVLALADVLLVNESSLFEFRRKAACLLQQLVEDP
ncbi:flagellar hook-basal body complex protein FliE [archaeon]|nr:flagellar hook-basal body complex protein FliE [archaeon]